jgi:hypothetical protein
MLPISIIQAWNRSQAGLVGEDTELCVARPPLGVFVGSHAYMIESQPSAHFSHFIVNLSHYLVKYHIFLFYFLVHSNLCHIVFG